MVTCLELYNDISSLRDVMVKRHDCVLWDYIVTPDVMVIPPRFVF
jgi:hypothetical protein